MHVDEKYYDEIFDFEGEWNLRSKCGLRIKDYGDRKVVIVTELYQDNPGSSITYGAGSLLEQICSAKGLDYRKVIYLECNPDTDSKLSFYDEEYFLTEFEMVDGKLINPKYTRLSDEQIKEIVEI
ncbi:MAG: hypothetical protein PHP76_07510 [Bacteroidales bacterium]|nr:hypothetical protein [Bacteroidales bacterium]